MKITPYLRPELVILELRAKGTNDIVRSLVNRAVELGVVANPEVLEALLLNREAGHTTAMGGGIAVPHATVPSMERPIILVAVAPEGAEFGDAGADPVYLFLLLLSPEDQAGLHIKLLARITRLVRHPAFLDRLRAARSNVELIAELESIDSEHL